MNLTLADLAMGLVLYLGIHAAALMLGYYFGGILMDIWRALR